MYYIEDHLRNIEERTLPLLCGQLDDLKDGSMRLGESRESGVWIDITSTRIRHLKESITEYEDIVAKLRAGETL